MTTKPLIANLDITSLMEWVWSKHTRTTQLACVRLLQPVKCYTQRQILLKERNQLEGEVHLKLGGENVVIAIVISITELLAASRWEVSISSQMK